MYANLVHAGASKIISFTTKAISLHRYNVLSLAIEKHRINPCICVRTLSTTLPAWKERARGKEKTKAAIPKKLDTSELETVLEVEELRADFERHLDRLKEDFMLYASLRTAAGSLESLKIKHKSKIYQLDELARVSRRAKEVIIDLSVNMDAVPHVVEALRSSEMRLNPRSDGNTVFVPLPKVTKEYRENLSKSAKAFCQKHCKHIKDVRNANVKIIMDSNDIPKDKRRRLEQTIDTMTKMYIQEAETMLDTKQKELNKTAE